MASSITVSNRPDSVDFDLSLIDFQTNYNIIIHYVYDPLNHFEEEFKWLYDIDDNTLVILWHPVEMGAWDQQWISKFNAVLKDRPFKFIYLTGCSSRLDLNHHFDIEFDYKFLPVFDIRVKDTWRYPGGIVFEKPNKFCFLNGKDVEHRRYILYQLFQHGLLNQGTVSYNCTNTKQHYRDFTLGRNFTPRQLQESDIAQRVTESIIPIKLDRSNFVGNLPRKTFTDCYVNIVCETDFVNVPFSYNRSFVTEKTFNAIANNQLFFIVGHAGSLQTLRDIGYRTFGDIINEDYDNILHNGDRLDAVTKEILRFLDRPISEIRKDYERAYSIIEHNRNFLFSQSLNQRMQTIVDEYARN